jgi:hydrogenase maturation protein HypF
VAARNDARWAAVLAMADRGINAAATSSAGRLFDAAAALIGVRDAINYEGQAAIELEQLADPAEQGCYQASISAATDDVIRVRGADLIRAAADDLLAGKEPPVIAARFHNGVADAIVRTCQLLRERTGLRAVALSGGVFQNLLLTDRVMTALEDAGFEVLVHGQVPCNDGGISLGQVAVAAAKDDASLA